jgi:hypothetical protein
VFAKNSFGIVFYVMLKTLLIYDFFTKFYQIFHNTRFEKESEKLDKKESYAKTI